MPGEELNALKLDKGLDFPKLERYTTVTLDGKEITAPVWYIKDNSILPFPMPEAKSIKLRVKKNDIYYYKLYMGFDIETSNVTVDIPRKTKTGRVSKVKDQKHMAFMYHWQISLASDEIAHVFMGRYWSEFERLMQLLTVHYKLDFNKRIICWIANTSFEFQFIRKRFEWDPEDLFAREERHPMKFRTGGWEFHEALTISGGSLGQLAKDYTTTQKLKGDLDYDVFRSGKTPLTPEEKSYCINDVVILSEWSKYIFDTYIIPDRKIPLTKTGLLRAECRAELMRMLGPDGARQYMQLIREAFPDQDEYEFWFRYFFRGGYVHSNILMTGVVIKKVKGKDRTSSYPAEMLLKLNHYPITPFKAEEFSEEALNTKCCIMMIRFKNIRRGWSHSIESKSKAIELEHSKKYPIVIDNGRIAQAGTLTVMLNELDFEVYKRFYIWDDMEVLSFETSERGPLPIFIRKVLAKYYKIKASLKRAGKQDTVEYVIAKQKVNSFFGMMVTRIELDKISYEDDDWKILEKELDFEDEIKSQFLLPQWGIWVTSLARYELLIPTADITEKIGDGRGKNGAGVIYNDTDSIKVYDPTGEAEKIIEAYNRRQAELIKAAGLTDPAFSDLGMYDHEGTYIRFKTLGAKRYLTEEHGKIKATIAGLPKASILNVKGDPFEAFNADGMLIDAEISLKNGISYIDEPTTYTAPDGEVMRELSSAGIFDMRFKMNLDKIYYTLVTDGLTERIRKYGD